jgi:hypothetical protein
MNDQFKKAAYTAIGRAFDHLQQPTERVQKIEGERPFRPVASWTAVNQLLCGVIAGI